MVYLAFFVMILEAWNVSRKGSLAKMATYRRIGGKTPGEERDPALSVGRQRRHAIANSNQIRKCYWLV